LNALFFYIKLLPYSKNATYNIT